MPPSSDHALVLFSGGQDSATCLAWALQRFAHVETVGFDYGQRHRVELAVRAPVREGLARLSAEWAGRLGVDHVLDLAAFGALSDTAMTREQEIRFAEDGLPTTFVPGRNILFFTYAAALAYRRGLRHLVGGMCETDYSGYPDCRDDTIKAAPGRTQPGARPQACAAYATDVARQGAKLANGGGTGRQCAGATPGGGHAQLLPGRPHPAA